MVKTKKPSICYFLLLTSILLINSCEKDVSVSGPEEYNIEIAKYYISTEPQGAAIFVDKKTTGLFTPDTVRWLSEGVHFFELKLGNNLYYSFTDTSIISLTNEFDYSFFSQTEILSSIKFDSTPSGCSVYINDSLANFKTPYILNNLLPISNKYKIKYTYFEHRSESTAVNVYPGKQSFVNMELIDTSVWVVYNFYNSPITENAISDIYVDDDNTCWIGTRNTGIIKMKNNRFEYFNKNNSNFSDNRIIKITKDAANIIWIATYYGLVKIEGNEIKSFTTSNSELPDNFISDVEFDNNGNRWIGTNNGLVKYSGEICTVYNKQNSNIPSDTITALFCDFNNKIWIGTQSGKVANLNDEGLWTTYQVENNIGLPSVSDLIIGTDNKLFVGFGSKTVLQSSGGVYILENEHLVKPRISIPDYNITKFHLDQNGTLWIGSLSCLMLMNENDYITRKITSGISGLPGNKILAVTSHKSGTIWVGTWGNGYAKYKIWKELF